MGLSLEQVIAGVTTTPAKMLDFPGKIGTLEPGVIADVSVLDMEQGSAF